MFMNEKQVLLLGQLLYEATSKCEGGCLAMANVVKFGLDAPCSAVHVFNLQFYVTQLLEKFKYATHIEIENCLTDADLRTVGKNCNCLASLKIISSKEVTNNGIHYLAFPTLTVTPFTSCATATIVENYFGVNDLPRANLAQTLTEVDITGAAEISEKGILIALAAFTSLKNIKCRNVLLCAALEFIETEGLSRCNSLGAIKTLECGTKQRTMYSVFEDKTGK